MQYPPYSHCKLDHHSEREYHAQMSSEQLQLANDIAKFRDDPWGFVLYAYPWGRKGTAVEHYHRPDTWQENLLKSIRDSVSESGESGVRPAIRKAVKSGHGVGKSALVSWLVHWFISTRPHPQIVVTANTQNQLKTKTWRELSKWHNMLINKDWFTWTATTFYFNEYPETWVANAIPWSANNPEAFAGTHDANVLIIFDEASGIDQCIWDTCEGAMTTEGAVWCAFGNPTRNSGAFYDCFNRLSHRWDCHTVDAQHAIMASPVQIDEWIADYGYDSDFVRVRVRGEFPIAGNHQLIPRDDVENAMATELKQEDVEGQPLIFGVDVARYGDDESVIYIRRGRKHFPCITFKGANTMELADAVSEEIVRRNPDAVFVDGGGVGGGVVDRLSQLGHFINEVNSSSSATDSEKFANKRAEMWDNMRRHLAETCDVVPDADLAEQLIAQEYLFDNKNRMMLVKKKDMKAQGLPSPDRADAMALTFARPVFSAQAKRKRKGRKRNTSWRIA